MTLALPTDAASLNSLAIENLTWPTTLTKVPKAQWPNRQARERARMKEIWRSRTFLVQVFAEKDGVERLSVCRTDVDIATGRWKEHISWDELQDLKRQCGRGDKFAVEIYPADADVVNVANMRHIWVMKQPLPFTWRTKP